MKITTLFWIGLIGMALMNTGKVTKQMAASDARQNRKEQYKSSLLDDKEKEREALRRARTCLLINEQYPLVEGGRAYYDPTRRKSNRILPTGTTLCSADSGYTAYVNSEGLITDVTPAPVERVREALRERGLLR